jgi:hypothetical protein
LRQFEFFVGKNRGGLVSMYKLFYNPFLRIRNSELKFVCRIIFPNFYACAIFLSESSLAKNKMFFSEDVADDKGKISRGI